MEDSAGIGEVLTGGNIHEGHPPDPQAIGSSTGHPNPFSRRIPDAFEGCLNLSIGGFRWADLIRLKSYSFHFLIKESEMLTSSAGGNDNPIFLCYNKKSRFG